MLTRIRLEQKAICKLIVIYIIGTLLLSIIGPITYVGYEFFRVFAFVIAVIISIMCGKYMSKGTFCPNKYIDCDEEINREDSDKKYIKLVNVCTLISLIIYSALFIELLYEKGFNITALFASLSNVGNIYKNYLHLEQTGTNTLVQITTLLSVIPFISMCGGVYFFKSKGLKKLWFILYAIISILEEVLRNAQLAFIVGWFLVVVSIFILKLVKNKYSSNANRKEISSKKRTIIVLALVFLMVFGIFQNSRAETYGYSTRNLSNQYFIYNEHHFVYQLLPDGIADTIAYLTFYLSGGYYGLGKNFDTDFVWTKGYGNSKGLSSYLNQYLKWEDTYQDSYPLRTEKKTGYPSGQYWSTVFSWLAGDFSFYGIPVFMFFLMIFYMKLYEGLRIKNNFFSLLMFVRLTEFFLFIPATNYIMQTRANVIITLSLLILLVISKLKMSVRIG
ncbi:MAG: hypothetical protein ACI4TK_19030 [Agathobacter sp.]